MARPSWTRWIFGLMVVTVMLYAFDVLDPATADTSLLQKYASATVWFGATILCAAKGQSAVDERAEWRLLALATALWGSASLYYSVFLWDLAVAPLPSPADAMWIAFYLPAYLGIFRLLRKRAGRFGRAVWLDALIGTLGVGGAVALMVFGAVLHTTTGTATAVLTNLAYPVGDFGLLTLVVVAMMVLGWSNSGVLRWLAPAFGLFAVADSFYLVEVANGTYAGGGLLDLGWPVAALLIGLAAWRAEDPPEAKPRTATVVGVPEAVGVGAIAVLVGDHFQAASITVLTLATLSLIAILLRLHLTVRENHRLLERSRHEAMTDALTGLGNRRQLAVDLEQHAQRLSPSRPLVLTLFDLDGFKQYNDTFGHPAGDQLLTRLGASLSELVADCGTAYRMGGDEFCTLWNLWDANAAGVTAEVAARGLSERGEGFHISSSHGSSILPEEAAEPEGALRQADARMYACKRGGRTSAGRQTADVLHRILAERDPDLRDHTSGVARLVTATAVELGASAEDVEMALLTALLHDIGKVAIPDAILSKPGPLDDAEWTFMQRHSVIGERIIAAAPSLSSVAKLVRATHESYDGWGYPDGVAGEDIPLVARIVAVCDAYDAMITTRPYRPARDPSEAVAELRRCSGTQFDAKVVEAFARTLETADAEDRPTVDLVSPRVPAVAAV